MKKVVAQECGAVRPVAYFGRSCSSASLSLSFRPLVSAAAGDLLKVGGGERGIGGGERAVCTSTRLGQLQSVLNGTSMII